MELIDFYDANNEWCGIVLKEKAHELGLWHRVFTCLLFDSEEKSVFFQIKNEKDPITQENTYLDISVGGHYKSGERIEDGIREIFEEAGIVATYNDLVFLKVRQNAFYENGYNCYEHQYLHLFDIAGKRIHIEDCKEVRGFVKIRINAALDILLGNIQESDAIFFNNSESKAITIRFSNFIPAFVNGDKLYMTLLHAANEAIEDRKTSK